MSETILKMRGVCKSFPGVKALQNVDFDLLRPLRHVLSVDKNTICQLVTHKDIVCNGQMIVQC